ncbi:TonB-dependent siderophore receptor [Pseudomonas sp. ABC1]|nr:TonB-dependent siderophore receptor [Pseudomonas sp. ABC1]
MSLAAWHPLALADNAQQQATRHYSIPAGPLSQVLTQFSSQAGILLVGASSLAQGRHSAGLEGDYGVPQALLYLLQGSGLQAMRQANGSYTLSQRDADDSALELGATSISGIGLNATGTTQGSSSYTATGPSNTAARLGLTLRETPQSITVVTRQKMDDENMQSLDDVAQSATGISYSKNGTERSYYYARGFEISEVQFDGMPAYIGNAYSMDALSINNMAIYDRVEFVRGANGLLQGAGNPSAAINLIRKRPTRDLQVGAELGAGSWDNYRTQLDVSGPLTQGGNLRGRAVTFYNTSGSFRDELARDNQLLYLIGELDLGERTVLTLGGTAQKDNTNGYSFMGLPTRADGSFYDFSRSTSLAADWGYLDKTNYSLFGDITHSLDNGWKLTAAFNRVAADADLRSLFWFLRSSDDIFPMRINQTTYKDRQSNFDLYGSGPFEWLGREHQLMLSASTRKDTFKWNVRNQASNYPVSVDVTNPGTFPFPNTLPTTFFASDVTDVRKEKGVSAATRISLNDSLSLILGSRLSWFDYEGNRGGAESRARENGKAIPYAGLVYDLDARHSLYASYTEIYRPQSAYGVGGSLLDAVTGENYEIGMKSEFFEGRLNTSLALFQVDQSHLPVAIAGLNICGVTASETCYRAGEKVRNRGFEAELSGSLAQGWNATLGYTYNDPQFVAGPNNGDDYNGRAKRLLKLSTDYRLPGALDAVRIGGSLYHQSRMTSEDRGQVIRQGAYTLLNLHGNYRINSNLDLQLNLNNALDKTYYQSISNLNFTNAFGDPRNVAMTLRYQL